MTTNTTTIQERFLSIRENKVFETFVITIIIVSALVIGAKAYAINEQVLVIFGVLDVAITLFRVATFEDWTDVMYETMAIYPLGWIFYLSFIFIVAFVFLNMMIGIVLEVLQREQEQFDRESGRGEAGEIHWLREHTELIEQRLERMEAMLADIQGKPHTNQKHS